MQRIPLGTSGLSTAPVGLGMMRISKFTPNEVELLVEHALSLGIDLFDHADIYGGGQCETVFGQMLKNRPDLRAKMILQSKCGICKGYYDASREHILTATDGILSRLGVESLDMLLLHRPDALMEPDEVAEAFTRLKAAGKVQHFGVSNENPGQIALLSSYLSAPLVANQMQLSLAHTGMIDPGINVNVHEDHAVQRDGSILDYCRLHQITVQAWSPFLYGMFEGVFLSSEKYQPLNEAIQTLAKERGVTDSAIAVAWILRHPAKIQTIVGTTSPSRLTDIMQAVELTLTRPEWYTLYKAAGNPIP